MKNKYAHQGNYLTIVLLLAGCVLANAQAQQRGKPVPFEESVAPSLGIKIIPAELTLPSGRLMTVIEVNAVQEGSSAYFVGIQPGDRILSAGSMNYLTPQQFLNYVNSRNRPGEAIQLVIDYLVSTTGNRSRYFLLPRFEEPGQGRWITTRQQHTAAHFRDRVPLAGRLESAATLKSQFQSRYDQAIAEIDANPCTVNAKALAAPLTVMASKASLPSSQIEGDLEFRARNGCVNQKEGPLPEFEATVAAMVMRLIDPCSYNPAADYSQALKAARQRIIKREYESLSLISRIRRRGARERPQASSNTARATEQACFLDFLQAALTGETVKPRAPDVAPPVPESATPPPPATVSPGPRRRAPQPESPPETSPRRADDSTAPTQSPGRASQPSERTSASVAGGRGRLFWTGQFSQGEILTISGNNISAGTLNGALPGIPVELRITDKRLEIIEPPSAANQWMTLRIKVLSAGRGFFWVEWIRK